MTLYYKLCLNLLLITTTYYRNLSEFGFPEPENVKSELEIERLKYDPAYQEDLLQKLNQKAPNNHEQMEVFNFVKTAIDNAESDKEQSSFIFINGPAGSGKSTLSQKSKHITLRLILDLCLLLFIIIIIMPKLIYYNSYGICKIQKAHCTWNCFNKFGSNGILLLNYYCNNNKNT